MNEKLPTPGLPRRLTAIVYDTLLVLPMLMACVALALFLGRAAGLIAVDAPLPPWLVWLLAVLCCVLFFGFFWLRGGQTLGMRAWRMRLVASDGEALNWRHCLLRCAAASLSLASLGLGYLWCLVDRDGRSLHDHLSGTRLVLEPKQARKPGKS